MYQPCHNFENQGYNYIPCETIHTNQGRFIRALVGLDQHQMGKIQDFLESQASQNVQKSYLKKYRTFISFQSGKIQAYILCYP